MSWSNREYPNVGPSGGGGATVSDVAYNSVTWDGVTADAPSKNAVRDKIDAMDTTIAGKAATAHSHAESDITNLTTDLAAKVDKVVGKGLSTEDYTTAEKTKLSGIAPSATANSTDATLLARANHTGTQLAATISDFNTAVATTAALKANNLSDLANAATARTNLGLGNVNNTSDATRFAGYSPVLQVAGSHIAGKVAGTYAIPLGDPLAVSGTGTLYPIGLIYIDSADYPTFSSLTAKLRIRASLAVNDVAPTGNFTFGLYPITRPATSGGAGLNIYTLGTVVSGSTGATFTAPAVDTHQTAVSSDFSLPANGFYCIGVVTTATVAVSSHVHVNAALESRYV